VFSCCCAVGYGCVVSYGLKGHRWHRSLRRCSPVKQSPSAHCPHNDISANLSCVELTATQLLNSGWRSPNEACTAGASVRARHRKEISRTGGAKSRRSILHVQRCCLYYLSVLREAKTPRLLHTCRGQAKQEMTGIWSARAVRLGQALACSSSSFPVLHVNPMPGICCDGAGTHLLSIYTSDEAIT